MKIEIWQPRWKDKTVLIAKHKVRDHSTIYFTRTNSIPMEATFPLTREQIMKHPLSTNGKIPCYEVPLSELGINL